MSISKLRSARAKALKVAAPARGNGAAGYVLPVTVSRGALLEKGSDRRFRTLVSDLFTIAARMEAVREHLGHRLGISGPQYSLLIAVAHLQGGTGVSVGAVAQAMHVSSAFVASETGKMARVGLLLKRANPQDRRGVLLSLAPGGSARSIASRSSYGRSTICSSARSTVHRSARSAPRRPRWWRARALPWNTCTRSKDGRA